MSAILIFYDYIIDIYYNKAYCSIHCIPQYIDIIAYYTILTLYYNNSKATARVHISSYFDILS